MQVDTRGEDNSTALHHASVMGRLDCIEALVKAGASVDALSNGRETPLHLATMYSTGFAVHLLVDLGKADVSIKHPYSGSRCVGVCVDVCVGGVVDGVSVTVWVVVCRLYICLLYSLLCACSLLHLSAFHGTSSCMKVLLDRDKCDVNAARQGDGYTPLHVAAAQGHIECSQLLLERGAGVNSRDASVDG